MPVPIKALTSLSGQGLDNNGVVFKDLLVYNTAIAAYFSGYKLSNLNTCQYKVVIRRLMIRQYTHIPTTTSPPGSISQRVIFGQTTAVTNPTGLQIVPITAVNYPYYPVSPYNYAEVTQGVATDGTIAPNATINVVNGNLNVLKYSSVNMYLQGANVTTG
jgi:hypothetical protein